MSTEQARRGPFLSQESPLHGINSKTLTSTPKFLSEYNDKTKFINNNNIHVIEEESLSMDGDDKKNDTDFDLQLLLKDNEKLQTQNAKLQQQLQTLNGDYTGVSFKFNQLQEAFKSQEQTITKLKGELAAQEISKKTLADALRAAQAKSAVAEETINSLRMQLSEMARSDCIERLRSQHEGQIQKMKDSLESERLKLMHDKDILKEEIESKDRRIAHIQQAMETMKRNSLEHEARRQSNGNTDSLRKLKTELTAVTDNNHNLKQQIEGLKQQIREAKTESDLHTANFQAKQVEINGLTVKLEDQKTLTQRQESELLSLRDSYLKATLMIESLKSKLEELVAFCQNLQDENQTLEKEVTELRKTRQNDEELIPKSQVEEFVSRSTKAWKEQVQKTYEESFQQQITQIKSQYFHQQQMQEQQLKKDVNDFISHLSSLADGSQTQEVSLTLQPIRDLWSSLLSKYHEQMEMLSSRKEQIDQALRELEEAVSEAKSESEESKHEEQGMVVDLVRSELEAAKREVCQLTLKLEKYKKHITQVKMNSQKEDERREKQFTAILKKKLSGMKEREETMKSLVSKDGTLLLQQINRAFSESIKYLKEQTDRYLEQSNSKSLEKMSQAIVNYHNLVMSKIEQRSKQLQQDLHASMSGVDNDISILEQVPPFLLH